MTPPLHPFPRPRLRPGARCIGLLALMFALPLRAQVPDTAVVADTVAAPADTLPDLAPADTADADTLPPPPAFPTLPDPGPGGWAGGEWVWDRQHLLGSTALTLLDLLEEIPGVTPVRFGLFGLPEAAASLGGTAGRTEVVLDGYTLDPLAAASIDFSRIELVQLRQVRVRRRLGLLRIELETVEPTHPEPYSLIEAGSGDLEVNLFRGLFLAPRVAGGQLGVAFERLASDGLREREPAAATTLWAKWGIVSGQRGVQIELRRGSIAREDSILPSDGVRTDLVLRARGRFLERLAAEAFVGRSSIDDRLRYGLSESDPETGTPADTVRLVERAGVQAGLRAVWRAEAAWAGAEARYRSQDALPALELRVRGGGRFGGVAEIAAELERADWSGEAATRYALHAAVGPFRAVRAFAELAGGDRGVPVLDPFQAPLLTERSGLRAGLAFERGGLAAGVAALRIDSTAVPAFGLPFDPADALFPAGHAAGWEATARLPIFGWPFALEGWYTSWADHRGWLYFPSADWRAALVYRHRPLESGSLDIRGSLAARHRGPMLVPSGLDVGRPPQEPLSPTVELVPATTVVDFDLVIRILEVRAFLRWENVFHQLDLYDLPGRRFPGQRIIYGVKWEFLN